jgi:hypothetical protein
MMKKTFLVCLIVVSGICINAQPVAKSTFIGGSVSLYFQNQKVEEMDQTVKSTRINILPKVGYFVSDRMAIGIKMGVTSNVENENVNSEKYKYTETLFSIAPFARYYLTSGTVGIFAEGSCAVGFGKMKVTQTDYSETSNIAQVMVGISPGIYYYIHPKLALEFSAGWLGYEYYSEKQDDVKRKRGSFGFDIKATGLSLGAIITL